MCIAVWYHYQIIRFTCCLNMLFFEKKEARFVCLSLYGKRCDLFTCIFIRQWLLCRPRNTADTRGSCVCPSASSATFDDSERRRAKHCYIQVKFECGDLRKIMTELCPPPLYSSFFNLLFRIKTFWRDAPISYNKAFLNAVQVKMLRFGL